MTSNIFPEDENFLKINETLISSCGSGAFLSEFLFPWQISLIRSLPVVKDKKASEWGGYETALRKRVAFSSHAMPKTAFEVTPVLFKPKSEILYSDRRTILNAFFDEGVPAESIGDILKISNGWVVLLNSRYKELDFGDVETSNQLDPSIKLQREIQPEVTGTVSSVRLDSVCSIAFKPSRSKLKGLIENGGAMVDYKFVDKAGKDIAKGSVVSLRGFPRFKLEDSDETSKKGRIRIKIRILE